MDKNLSRISRYLGVLLVIFGINSPAVSRPLSSCPENLNLLVDRLLSDLPGYANRVMTRSQIDQKLSTPVFVIIAGRPEFAPLPLSANQYSGQIADDTQQVFFTTLERQYGKNRSLTLQNYHWLFLTKTGEGWRLVTIYSQLAALEPAQVPLPPLETSQGTIGQAVRLWLRDCEAGTLR
ncbi:hypothetical protein D3800_04640 [Microcystis aeruginosa NIES-298]|uniref:Uncharacterized protein n=1 Tax=Microcystis aeruginosa NIES-298 TaxID=449468 RepID=A0A9P2YJH5_MICAE|nr:MULTISPECIES: hypothetical protein [Microcystis]MCA2626266.1 hypothetical protein [Microcystis sp. M19BS1]MCA2631925.1 hypothetical protein [Microcystis sp. M20BS1]MDB9386658.1 hypothetical protein [Microcystis aeruginosa CS-583]QHU82692.1 hypothetical protein D3800_04640 [Microcystis aeruginosa NIES-298]GBD53100.1 hypothetical protein BGM30_21930 [Microcystis aeruginosa NIES-298]